MTLRSLPIEVAVADQCRYPPIAIKDRPGGRPRSFARGSRGTEKHGGPGPRAVFSIAELDPAFRPGAAILADRRVGAPLENNEGPWRLVVEADAKPERSVRQVESITVTVLP